MGLLLSLSRCACLVDVLAVSLLLIVFFANIGACALPMIYRGTALYASLVEVYRWMAISLYLDTIQADRNLAISVVYYSVKYLIPIPHPPFWVHFNVYICCPRVGLGRVSRN